MLRFPIGDLLDEEAHHNFLRRAPHPNGLTCPRSEQFPPNQAPLDRRRAPIIDYRCQSAGRWTPS